MITIECPDCNISYSKQRVPKVLPCGHSICSICLNEMFQYRGFYQCRQCAQKFEVVPYSIPTNMLYFEMIQRIDKFIRQKEWELGTVKENQRVVEETTLLRIQQQCLYTFCQRKKFERDGVIELYCSQECKKNHQQLQEIIA